MCRRVTCPACGKPSWAGCGAHVEAVLGDVPREARCRCKETPEGARPPREATTPGWLSSLLGGPRR